MSTTAAIIEATAAALDSLPEPVAAALDRHARNGLASDDPCLSAVTIITDAALYQDAEPALVLWWDEDHGHLFMEGHPDDAAETARRHRGRPPRRRAWWCALDVGGNTTPEWREVSA
jgi:hypothetical protein